MRSGRQRHHLPRSSRPAWSASCFAKGLIGGLGLALLSACGGGGGGSSAPPPAPTPPPVTVAPDPPPDPLPTVAELERASKFAARTTFGLPYSDIEAIAEVGVEDWLEEQFQQPVNRHKPAVDTLKALNNAGRLGEFPTHQIWRVAWWHRTMTAEDVVRQRVAFALSQIFVVGEIDMLADEPWALTTYYDVLLENAFGNFQDLLLDVTLHPSMGIYLSHVNNAKADPVRNTYPDQNYAREVMQLFTIGLYELNLDGSLKQGEDGLPIATYDNDDIAEFAKVFTGLSYGGDDARFGKYWPWFLEPMTMFEEFHEPGEKRLLGGTVLPAGQSGMADIEAAVNNLFEHPNVGPFIGRQLIQRLVRSNPSPDYVERVARAFNGDDTGVRGDMGAVLRAILLDDEAWAPPDPRTSGKMRAPVLRHLSLARQFRATSEDGTFYSLGYALQYFTSQHPLASPSVFNFFLPSHSPQGEIADAGLVAPEFEIVTPTTVIGAVNLTDLGIFHDGQLFDVPEPFPRANLNLSEYVRLADDVGALMDRLDLVMTHGELSDDTRAAIADIVEAVDDPEQRARHAVYLMSISPDFVVAS